MLFPVFCLYIFGIYVHTYTLTYVHICIDKTLNIFGITTQRQLLPPPRQAVAALPQTNAAAARFLPIIQSAKHSVIPNCRQPRWFLSNLWMQVLLFQSAMRTKIRRKPQTTNNSGEEWMENVKRKSAENVFLTLVHFTRSPIHPFTYSSIRNINTHRTIAQIHTYILVCKYVCTIHIYITFFFAALQFWQQMLLAVGGIPAYPESLALNNFYQNVCTFLWVYVCILVYVQIYLCEHCFCCQHLFRCLALPTIVGGSCFHWRMPISMLVCVGSCSRYVVVLLALSIFSNHV